MTFRTQRTVRPLLAASMAMVMSSAALPMDVQAQVATEGVEDDENKTRALRRQPTVGDETVANDDLGVVRAIVVGIDDYLELGDLQGAANDARDIHGALLGVGVEDVTLLLNDAATKDALMDVWLSTVRQSQPGDTIFFSYAGHGAQQAEFVHGEESDGKDEVLVLGGFRSTGPAVAEHVLDNQLSSMFADATEKGIQVIFVADSCHSGGATRSLRQHDEVTYRVARGYDVTADMLSFLESAEIEAEATNDYSAGHLDGLFFIGGSQEFELIPEVPIRSNTGEMQIRGALSHSIARALEGEGDRNGDGVIGWNELRGYVEQNVRVLSDARQTPNLLPTTQGDVPLISLKSSQPEPLTPVNPPVRVMIEGGTSLDRDWGERLDDADLVRWADQADLLWSPDDGAVLSPLTGDYLAWNIRGRDLQDVVDRWRAIDKLKRTGPTDRLAYRLEPSDKRHKEGSSVTLEVDQIQYPYFLMFGISGDGTVYLHYPLVDYGDTPRVEPGTPLSWTFEVTAPFGADYVVGVAAPRPLDREIQQLLSLDGRRASEAAVRIVDQIVRSTPGAQVGLQGLFTEGNAQ